MRQEIAVDGFRLAYDRTGQGPRNPADRTGQGPRNPADRTGQGPRNPAVLLLHGWPGDRTDYRDVAPLLAAAAGVIVPDLRGFGESDKHPAEPASQYTAAAQARSLIALIGELGLSRPVIAGYDIGSRTR